MTDSSIAIHPATTRIGWIGTGVMGRSMCGHLIEAGYKATIFNRTVEKAGDLIGKGATLVGSPREVAEQSDVVFTIVGFPDDVQQVILGQRWRAGGIDRGDDDCRHDDQPSRRWPRRLRREQPS